MIPLRFKRLKARIRQRIGLGPVGLGFAFLMGWYGLWLLAGAAIQVARLMAQ